MHNTPNIMEFHFKQTPDHLYDFTMHHWKNSRMVRLLLILLAILIVTNVVMKLSEGTEAFTIALLSWLLPLLIITALMAFLLRFLLKRRFNHPKNQPLFTGDRQVSLLDNEVKVKTPVTESIFKWETVTKLEESAMSYFIYMGNYTAIIVPKSAFLNDGERIKFEELIYEEINR